MIAASVAKVWELVLILTELKSCLFQFTHTKQRGTSLIGVQDRDCIAHSVSKHTFQNGCPFSATTGAGSFHQFILPPLPASASANG